MSDNPLASQLIAGLERFAADLAAGRLERHRGRITTIHRLDAPCPACGGQLLRSSGAGTCCANAAGGCRYSWGPKRDGVAGITATGDDQDAHAG